MTDTRYNALMSDSKLQLTEAEISEGWHFCPEWDDLLIGVEMGEWKSCGCEVTNYETKEGE